MINSYKQARDAAEHYGMPKNYLAGANNHSPLKHQRKRNACGTIERRNERQH